MKKIVEFSDQLKGVVWKATFGGFFIMSLASAIVWAGAVDFGVSKTPVIFGFTYAVALLFVFPALYFTNRKRSPLWVNGVMGIFGGLIPATFLLGFGALLFYFGFVIKPRWVGFIGVIGACIVIFLWSRSIYFDVIDVLNKNSMHEKAYVKIKDDFYYEFNFMQEFEKHQKERSPFKSYHIYAALIVTPLVFVLNRFMSPIAGSGHGVFFVLSFFGLPMSMWLYGIATRSFVLMIYYPFKIWRATGQQVLMRGFV